MRAFSISDRQILEASPFITSFGKHQITFTSNFIHLILSGERNGLGVVEFFNKTLGVTCFNKKYVDSCTYRWRKSPPSNVKAEQRGRRRDLQKMSLEELKAENAYQREVIDHLKKLRGLTDSDL